MANFQSPGIGLVSGLEKWHQNISIVHYISVTQQDYVLKGLQSMAVFENSAFYYIITHLNISAQLLLYKDLSNKIRPELHLLLRKLEDWMNMPDYKIHTRPQALGFC